MAIENSSKNISKYRDKYDNAEISAQTLKTKIIEERDFANKTLKKIKALDVPEGYERVQQLAILITETHINSINDLLYYLRYGYPPIGDTPPTFTTLAHIDDFKQELYNIENPPPTPTPPPTSGLEVENLNAYPDSVGWKHILFEIKNYGYESYEFIQVQITTWDSQGRITSSDTLYPSPYPNWGLGPKQSFTYEYYLDPEIPVASYEVKIVNYR